MVLPYFIAVVLGISAPNLTLTQYAHHYDTIHIPLVKSLTGASFPTVHTRYYAGGAFANASAPVDWDSMAVMQFRDQAHAVEFLGLVSRPDIKERIEEDEGLFMAGKPRTVVVGMEGAIKGGEVCDGEEGRL